MENATLSATERRRGCAARRKFPGSEMENATTHDEQHTVGIKDKSEQGEKRRCRMV